MVFATNKNYAILPENLSIMIQYSMVMFALYLLMFQAYLCPKKASDHIDCERQTIKGLLTKGH